MPASSETIRLQGFRELQLAFKLADRALAKELRTTLREVVEPIRVDAENLAESRIPRIGLPWSRMRIGTTLTSVYLAPKQRGSRIRSRRRPNLAELLLGRSMEPALDRHRQEVIAGVDAMLGSIAGKWEAV